MRRPVDGRPPGPRPDGGDRAPADDRHAVGAAGAGLRRRPTSTTSPTTSSGSSTTTPSRTCSGRCRSTCRTRCSTTTRRRSVQAGLDPEEPPTTLDEVKATAQSSSTRASSAQAGFGAQARPVVPRSSGSPRPTSSTSNNGNGRESRADRGDLRQRRPARRSSRGWPTWSTTACGERTRTSRADQLDNLLGIGNEQRRDDDRLLRRPRHRVRTCSRAGSSPDVEPGVAPLPGLAADGGVLGRRRALYIVNQSAPGEAGGGVGVRQVPERAAEPGRLGCGHRLRPDPEVGGRRCRRSQELWAEQPGFKVAYDQLLEGRELAGDRRARSSATYAGVRAAIVDGMRDDADRGHGAEGGVEGRRSRRPTPRSRTTTRASVGGCVGRRLSG